jgi:hypothetical protein
MAKKQSVTHRQRLCEKLLAAAEEHGAANGDYEYQLGDVEDFFRAAFSLLTEKQCDAFWNDARVSSIVYDLPEYQPISMEIYGESGWDEDDDEEEDQVDTDTA